jgi:serine/threonine protein kinase
LNGLKELHSNDLAHRDIKPENIVLVDNKIKIGDISLISHTNRKSYAGTELFIPQDVNDIPREQFGVSCDLFAAGKVLYALLANEEDITKFPQISRKMLQDTLAKKLNLIINKACDPAYQNRFTSAYEFIQALNKTEIY